MSQKQSTKQYTVSEITRFVDLTVLGEARRNELTVAWVRFCALCAIAAQHWLSVLAPGPNDPAWPLSLPLVCTAWALAALALAIAMRHGFYRDALRVVIPVSDAAMINLVYLLVRGAIGRQEFLELGGMANLGISCALLTVTGAMRLSRGAVALTTALGIAVHVSHAALAGTWSQEMARGITLLAAIGYFASWMTQLVRRGVEGEIGRGTLRRFLPASVIDAAFADPKALVSNAKECEVTVLVSDLRGSTALAEQLSPAGALNVLSEVQGALAAAVREHGGTVDKFMGDGLLAVFGAHESAPDHAGRALRAAVAMRDAMAKLNRERRARQSAELGIGIGVHSGDVIAGCLGSGDRLEYTVIGDAVNVASRLESETKQRGDAIIVSGETIARAAPDALAAVLRDRTLVPLGDVSLRGRRQALGLHALRQA